MADSRRSTAAGLNRKWLLVAVRNTEPRNCCWRLIRSMSPSGSPWRCRTKARAWSPTRVCSPTRPWNPLKPSLMLVSFRRRADLLVARGQDADLHAVDRLADLLEAVEVDRDVVVDADAGHLLDRAHQQRRAADADGGVELVLARGVGIAAAVGVGRDGHQGVARERHVRRRAVAVEVGEDDGVAALAGAVAVLAVALSCRCRPAASSANRATRWRDDGCPGSDGSARSSR